MPSFASPRQLIPVQTQVDSRLQTFNGTSIANAAELTAHERYQEWYLDTFRGTKRGFEDAEYVDDSAQFPGPSLPVQSTSPLTHSMSWAIRQQNQDRLDGQDLQVVELPDFLNNVTTTLSNLADHNSHNNISV